LIGQEVHHAVGELNQRPLSFQITGAVAQVRFNEGVVSPFNACGVNAGAHKVGTNGTGLCGGQANFLA
jgi:hypothetical protein